MKFGTFSLMIDFTVATLDVKQVLSKGSPQVFFWHAVHTALVPVTTL